MSLKEIQGLELKTRTHVCDLTWNENYAKHKQKYGQGGNYGVFPMLLW